MPVKNKHIKILLPFLAGAILQAQIIQAQSTAKILLPNGWSLTPAGTSVNLSSDLPLNIAVAPGGKYAAITNNGNGKQTIDLIDLKQQKLVQQVNIDTAWLGLAFEKKHPYLYASGGNANIIIRYQLKGGMLVNKDTLHLGAASWPVEKIGAAGLAVDDDNNLLYVATKENNRLYICNTTTTQVIQSINLSQKPYTCLLSPSNNELYISAWGGGKVWILNTTQRQITDSITTEDHPNDMAVSRNGKWLYVANANANSVSVIDVAAKKVVETLNAALYPGAPIGSTTNAVALSADDKTLYIANADNNCLAVFDVSNPGHSSTKGFIPVGWYPTGVKVVKKQILVTNGKGMSSMANANGPQPLKSKHKALYKRSDGNDSVTYIGNMFKGTLSTIVTPKQKAMQGYTAQVYLNSPYSKQKETSRAGNNGNPLLKPADSTMPIKHVFYVLKENRTYDQVLGDMPQGNGDTSLCIFGKNITPNAHALADQFVLLDNFYVDAEVSADGHNWSMAGYATDYVEKNWPTNYSGRGGNYDFGGGMPVANPTKGFIWDYCQRAGVSFRNYGEFMDEGEPSLPVLKKSGNYCHQYPGWNLDFEDVEREKIFEHDFDSLIAINKVPAFNTVYLPNDHTYGSAAGKPTPLVYLADNDLALGRLIEHISHSAIWKESAIFVLEDDAQDGPDHVDAHRSPAYIISPYIKMHSVDHTPYTTSSMLRTMELIVGLPPMSQYDAAATPMWNSFNNTADVSTFTARTALVDLKLRNPSNTKSAAQTAMFDFKKPDNAPDLLLNQVIWQTIKGENAIMPAPKRSAFVVPSTEDDDD